MFSSAQEDNIITRTEKFHQDVIETTMDALAERLSDNGLSEELLDRIKADWEKALRDAKAANLKAAQIRQAEQLQI